MREAPQLGKFQRRLLLAGAAIVLGVSLMGLRQLLANSADPAPVANSAILNLAHPDAMDVNGDEQVDVLDAYLLARQDPPRTAQMRLLIAHITSGEAAQ